MPPLFVYKWNNYFWCTTDEKEIPKDAAYHPIHMTKETIEYYLDNHSKLKENYPDLIRIVEDKYKDRVAYLLTKWYELPDANWSECNVDD